MDPTTWAEFGAIGVMAGSFFFLYLRERKETSDYTKRSLEHQSADAAAKNKLAVALEGLAETVEVTGNSSKSDITACKSTCSEMIIHMREQMAREFGRQEITDRFQLGDGNEK